jgi:hypothetical protein
VADYVTVTYPAEDQAERIIGDGAALVFRFFHHQ